MKNLSYKKFTLALFAIAVVFSFGFTGNVMGTELPEGDITAGGGEVSEKVEEVIDKDAIDESKNQNNAANLDETLKNEPSADVENEIQAGEAAQGKPPTDPEKVAPAKVQQGDGSLTEPEPKSPPAETSDADAAATGAGGTPPKEAKVITDGSTKGEQESVNNKPPKDPYKEYTEKAAAKKTADGEYKTAQEKYEGLKKAADEAGIKERQLNAADSNAGPDAKSKAATEARNAEKAASDARTTRNQAKQARDNANAEYATAKSGNKEEIIKRSKTDLKTAEDEIHNQSGNVETSQKIKDDYEQSKGKPDPSDSKYKNNDDPAKSGEKNPQYKQDLEDFNKQMEGDPEWNKFDGDVNTAKVELAKAKGNFERISNNLKDLEGSFWGNAKDKVLGYAKKAGMFLLEQIIMSLSFALPAQIFSAVTAAQQNKKLYAEIMSEQKFAGIRMQIPPGLVPYTNPAGGAFVYYDVQVPAGSPIPSAYLEAPERRWFVSYDPNAYGSVPGAAAIGQQNFPNSMVELSTGLIFDGSGSITYPSYKNEGSELVNFPTVVLLTDEGGSPIWTSNANQSLQNMISDLLPSVSGQVKDSVYPEISPVSLALSLGNLKMASNNAGGNNPSLTKLFTAPTTTVSSKTTYFLPSLLANTLASYIKGFPLDGFGVDGVAATSTSSAVTPMPLILSELQGLSCFNRIFGREYFDIFLNKQSQNFKIGQQIITTMNHLPLDSSLVDITIPALSPNIQFNSTVPGSLDSIINGLGFSSGETVGQDVGFSGTEHPLAHGLPLYQTDCTPTAVFLKNFVQTTSSAAIASYIHDIVVPIDEDGNMVPAHIPSLVNGTVEFVSNPAVQYVTSLVSGLTYQKNNGYVPISDNNAQANIVIGVITKGSGSQGQVMDQINQMRELYNSAITDGPFTLASGLYAFRVSLESMQAMELVYNSSADLAAVATAIATGASASSISGLSQAVQNLIDADSFVYMIPNALDGLDDKGNVTKLPDYVIPVAVDNSGGFLIVPLGSQAALSSGIATVVPSQQVSYLISLVTSRFYSANYTLITSRALIPGSNVSTSLGTEFMETDLNPVNFDSSNQPLTQPIINVPALYFLNRAIFSFCPGLVPDQSTASEGAPFMTSSGCSNATLISSDGKTPLTLNQVLPSIFTGLTPTCTADGVPQGCQNLSPYSSSPSTSPISDQLNLALTSTLSGTIPSIGQVYSEWRKFEVDQNVGITRAACKLQLICNNNDTSDWFITATGPIDVKNGNYFYLVINNPNTTNGLWVVASYNPSSGSVNPNLSGGSVSLSNFSNIGTNFVDASNINALINVGTGAVLIKTQDTKSSDSGATTMVPLMRYSKSYQAQNSTTIPAIPLGQIFLDPNAVIEVALENNKTDKLTESLKTRITQEQGYVADTSIMGPYQYGHYTLTLDRQTYNDGNCIYTAKDPSGDIQDYFITYDNSSNSTLEYGKPYIPNSTLNMVSIISGNVYTSSGVVSFGSGIYENTINGLSNNNSLNIPQYFEGILETQSGNPLNNATLTTGINDLYTSYNAHQNQNSTTDPQQSLDDASFAIAEQITCPVVTLNALSPVGNTGPNNQLVKDPSTGIYYLRSIAVDGKFEYYQFNIAPSVYDTSTPSTLVVPTGVFFDENGKATSVLVGQSAVLMLGGYGLTLDTNYNVVPTGFPAYHPSLPMTNADIALTPGEEGYLMRVLAGSGKFYTSGNTYCFYQNIYHPYASTSQLTSYNSDNQSVYSPYDILLQITPNQTQNSLAPENPSYTSIITGTSYDITGKELYDNIELYFQNVNGSLMPNLPLMVWSSNTMTTQAILGTNTTASSMAEGSVTFNTYQLDSFGISYEYVDSTTGNNTVTPVIPPNIYTYTYNDPSYYLTSFNPAFSLITHDPKAVKDPVTGTYTPAPNGLVYKVDLNGNQIGDPYGSQATVTTSKAIKNAIQVSMTAALIANNIGLVYKVGENNSVIATYGVAAVPKDKLFIMTINSNTYEVTLTDPNITAAIATNMQLAQNANPITGVVYQVPAGSMKATKTFPANGQPCQPVAPATTVTGGDIQIFAAQNLIDALNDALNSKFNPSRKLMNMTSISSVDKTFPKIMLVQDLADTLKYSLYYPNTDTSNNAAIAVYTPVLSNVYQANVVSFVGQRAPQPSGSFAPLSPNPSPSDVYNAVLIKNMKTGNYDYIIWTNSFYYAQQLGSATQSMIFSTCLPGSSCSTTANNSLTFSIKSYSDVTGVNPSAAIASSWPSSAPALYPSQNSYVSIVAEDFSIANPNSLTSLEHIYQYNYSTGNQAIYKILEDLDINLVESSNGVLTPITSIDPTKLKPITFSAPTQSESTMLTGLFTAAITKANQAITTAQNNVTAINTDKTSTDKNLSSQSQKSLPCSPGYVVGEETRTGVVCVLDNPVVLSNYNSNDPSVSSNNSAAALAAANQAVTAAQNNLTALQNAQTANLATLATRVKNHNDTSNSALSSLYYQIVVAADSNGTYGSVPRFYCKVNDYIFSKLSGSGIFKDDYINYPIGSEQGGFIYKGPRVDTTGKATTLPADLGTPSGSSLSSADMTILKSLIGQILPKSTQLTPNQLGQNGVYSLTAGSVTFNNLLYFGDLTPVQLFKETPKTQATPAQ